MTIKYAIFRLSYKYRIANICNVVNTRDEMMKELFKLYQKQLEYYTQIKDSEDLYYDDKIRIKNAKKISLEEIKKEILFIQKNISDFSECNMFEVYKIEKIHLNEEELK